MDRTGFTLRLGDVRKVRGSRDHGAAGARRVV
jgi:hypothetical protein